MISGRWARARLPDLATVALVAAFALPWATLHTSVETARGDDALAVALRLTAAIAMLWRRQRPLLTLALAGLAIGSCAALNYAPSLASVAFWIALYSAARYAARRTVTAAMVAGAIIVVAVSAAARAGTGDLIFQLAADAVAMAAGWLTRRRDTSEAALRNRAMVLEQEESEHVREAVAAERVSIARDLHDVIAHGLGVIVVQATAARHVHAEAPAAASLEAIELAAREAMTEMRTLLAVIRSDEGDGADVLGVDALPALVDRARAAGAQIDFVEHGARRRLPAMIDLSLFRIVQESVTNVLKHSPDRVAKIDLSYQSDAVSIRVESKTGAASGGRSPGFGLVGMKERVAVLSGEFSATSADGLFVVEANLPTPAHAPAQ